MKHLQVVSGRVGLLAQGHDFPQEDSEGPNVGLAGEDAVNERFRSHPSDRKQALAFLPVVVVLVNVSRQPEVADLDDAAQRVRGGHQAVSAGQIAVDKVHFFQVLAAVGHVHAHLQQFD